MKYSIFKLEFSTGVHFGKGLLNDSQDTFTADILFSALYIEALKNGMQDVFYQEIKEENLLFSDALPYVGKQYLLPKPCVYVEHARQGDSEEKKKFKKMKYLPVEKLDDYLAGTLNPDQNPMNEFGKFEQRTLASVRREEDTLPYRVGVFRYQKGNGLYVLAAGKEERQLGLLEELLEMLSYTGIGGKKSDGLGKFTLKHGTGTELLLNRLQKKTGRYMLLSSALPRDEELDAVLEGASYLLDKHSGFIFSDHYADEIRKKKDLYMFSAGSCFLRPFHGDIFDVSEGGRHPVYRYGKPFFLEV